MTGLAHARGELVFLIDSDLEEDPELLPSFSTTHARDAAPTSSTACSTRGGAAWFERVSGWLFFKVFNLLSDQPIPDNLVTVRLMTRRYVAALLAHREREMMIAGLWALTGFRQVPLTVTQALAIDDAPTACGARSPCWSNSITSFSDRPLVLIFYLGLCIVVLLASAGGGRTWSFAGCSSASLLPAGRRSSCRSGCSAA